MAHRRAPRPGCRKSHDARYLRAPMLACVCAVLSLRCPRDGGSIWIIALINDHGTSLDILFDIGDRITPPRIVAMSAYGRAVWPERSIAPSNGCIWNSPRLQALRSLALRYDCSRMSGPCLPHRAIDGGPQWAIRAPAPNRFLNLEGPGHSRVSPAPVRPVGHQVACIAIVVDGLRGYRHCCFVKVVARFGPRSGPL